MRQLTAFLILIATSIAAAAPAQACQVTIDQMNTITQRFWPNAPAEPDADDIVLEVRFLRNGQISKRNNLVYGDCYRREVFEVIQVLQGPVQPGTLISLTLFGEQLLPEPQVMIVIGRFSDILPTETEHFRYPDRDPSVRLFEARPFAVTLLTHFPDSLPVDVLPGVGGSVDD